MKVEALLSGTTGPLHGGLNMGAPLADSPSIRISPCSLPTGPVSSMSTGTFCSSNWGGRRILSSRSSWKSPTT